MSILVELSEEELADLKAFTKQADDVAAVRCAISEYFRFARRLQLKALSGLVEMEENWPTLEASELHP